VKQVVGAETDFIARQPKDAWIAGPKHLDLRSTPQSKLLEPVDMIGMAEDMGNQSAAAGGEAP
jgi:hypothetical protein